MQDDENRKLVDGFLNAVRSRDRDRLYRWVAKNELSKLDAANTFIEAALQRTADMLCGRVPAGSLSLEEQMHLYRLLQQCSDYLKVNVNAKHIFSLLTANALCREADLVPETDAPYYSPTDIRSFGEQT